MEEEKKLLEAKDFPLDRLRPHPLNEKLYPADEVEDQELKDSINQYGILDALVALPDGTIISGTRRWRIARKLGLQTVPVEFREFDDPEQTILEYNKYRKKTWRIIANELEFINEKLAPKAQERFEATLPKSGEKGFKPVSALSSLTKHSEPIHVREKAAEMLGVSEGQLHKIEYIHKHEHLAKPIVKKLDQGEITVHKAFEEIQKIMEPQPLEEEEEESETWKCDACNGEFEVEAPTRFELCPRCIIDFNVWKTEKDYAKDAPA